MFHSLWCFFLFMSQNLRLSLLKLKNTPLQLKNKYSFLETQLLRHVTVVSAHTHWEWSYNISIFIINSLIKSSDMAWIKPNILQYIRLQNIYTPAWQIELYFGHHWLYLQMASFFSNFFVTCLYFSIDWGDVDIE